MGSFANMTANLNLNIKNFANNMNRAGRLLRNFTSKYSTTLNTEALGASTKHAAAFKDPSRIIQGILVSKAFYSIFQSVRNATQAVWDFSNSLEYADMVYTNLFNSAELAAEFINVLKDFSATTPFTFEQSESAAKRLLAYGIQYRNVMYVMQGVLAASTAQNNPAIVESVSRALGQIYTKGRLMNEEMRQLAEAGIPAYEILKEKLGLTQAQLQNLGKVSIPASKAINALVDGMSERFGGVIKQSSLTTQGIISNLKDNGTMLLSGVFSPLIGRIKKKLGELGDYVYELRTAFETGGIGAVFERMVPKHLQTSLRIFIANIKSLFIAIKPLLTAIKQFASTAGTSLLHAINAVMPILVALIDVFTRLTKWITSNEKAMRILNAVVIAGATVWALYKVKALGALVISALTKVINGLAAALSALAAMLVSHPILTLLMLLTGVAVGVISHVKGMDNAIGDFIKNLTRLNGVDTDKLLLPSQKERNAELSKFNERLDDTADNMDKLADSTGKAAKAAKNLLSFDEVFKLNEDVDEDTDVDDDVYDVPSIDTGTIDTGSLMPDDNSFTSFATDFVDNVGKFIKSKIVDAGFSGLLGGALAGGLIGAIWGPGGAAIGVAIGAFVGWLIEVIIRNWDAIVQWFKKVGTWFSNTFKVVSDWLGKVLSAVGSFFTNVWTSISTFFTNIFTAVGTFFTNVWTSVTTFFTNIWTSVTTFFTNVWTFITKFVQIFSIIGNAIAGLASIVWGKLVELAGIIKNAFVELGTMIKQAMTDLWKIVSNFFAPILKSVGTFFTNIWNKVSTFFTNVWTKVSTFFTNVWSTLSTWVSKIWTAVSTLFTNIITNVTTWLSSIFTKVSTWFTNIVTNVTTWLSSIFTKISTWFTDIITKVATWLSSIFTKISTWFTDIITKVATWLSNILTKVSSWFTGIITKIASWFSSILSTISNWFTNLITKVASWLSSVWNKVSSWGYTTSTNIFSWFENVLKGIAGWFTRLVTNVGKWFGNLWNEMTGWLSDIWTEVSDWWNSLWSDKSANVSVNGTTYTRNRSQNMGGHASGGVFNREHIARFAEGNKAEAIIPLENRSAMQPFVDAVSDGLAATLLPIVATLAPAQQPLQPLYVGTLIADDRGLRELNKKMQIIQVEDNNRRGK